MNWIAQSSQIILPRHERGVDHGASRALLLLHGDRKLYWQSGCSFWNGIGAQGYAPAHLSLELGNAFSFGGRSTELFTGTFSRKKLEIVLPQIREFFGVDLPPLNRRVTFVWEPHRAGSVST